MNNNRFSSIFWDFGGVITSSPFEAFARYEEENHLPKDFIRQVNSTNPDTNAWALLEQSKISLEEFDSLFSKESHDLGHKINGVDVLFLLQGHIRPAMINVLKKFKEKGKKQLMAEEFNYNMQLAEIQASATARKEQEIEDRKDKRVKIQGTQQSELIDQRKNDLLPKDFESAGNDNLSGFGLEQFEPR